MKNVLLDSDIILDFFFDREPHSKYSSYVLSQIESRKINGYLTAVIISNVYYLLRQQSTHERVIKKLNQLMTLIDVLVIDKLIILKAMNSKFKDFEDALQNYACETYGKIDLILTRNTKDYQKKRNWYNDSRAVLQDENRKLTPYIIAYPPNLGDARYTHP